MSITSLKHLLNYLDEQKENTVDHLKFSSDAETYLYYGSKMTPNSINLC